MIRIAFSSIAVAALCVMSAALAQAQGPAARPGTVTGPIVGVGRSQPLTPEQQAEEQRQQIKTLLDQFAGDDTNLQEFAESQLLKLGKEALPQVQSAADAKNLPGPLRHRYALLLKTINADVAHRAAVEKYLKEKKITRGDLIPISDASLQSEFPKLFFYTLRFRQFPVAFEVPAGMKPSNVLAVLPDGSIAPVPDAAALTALFQKHAPATQDADTAKHALRAWLRISEEWRQDGFYHFDIPDRSMQAEKTAAGLQITGKAIVTAGGKGEITATLTFNAAGTLTQAKDEGELREGVRPICQATKLLDHDPIVRGMARQCILTMGLRAHDYLVEQRAKAPPPLQKEIDRIWTQILNDGR